MSSILKYAEDFIFTFMSRPARVLFLYFLIEKKQQVCIDLLPSLIPYYFLRPLAHSLIHLFIQGIFLRINRRSIL
ncbi:MAG: hypothetical protein ACFWTP_05950 [Enterococcus gilvus]|jgi:hypothetical protein